MFCNNMYKQNLFFFHKVFLNLLYYLVHIRLRQNCLIAIYRSSIIININNDWVRQVVIVNCTANVTAMVEFTPKTPSDKTPVGKFIYSVAGTSSNAHISQVFISGTNKLTVTSTMTQGVHITIVELYK